MSFVLIKDTKKRKIIYLLVCFGLMAVISGLRGKSVGTDTQGYYHIFENLKSYGLENYTSIWKTDYAFLYMLNLNIKTIDNFQVALLTMSIFTSFCFGRFIFKYSKNIVVSTLLYFLFVFPRTMNICRMYVAIGFFLLAIEQILKKRKIMPFIFVIFASFIHLSAVFLLPFCFLSFRKKMNFKIFIIIVLACVTVAFALPFASIVAINIAPKYSAYLVSSDQYISTLSWKYAVLYAVVLLMLISCFYLNKQRKLISDDDNNIFLFGALFVCSVVFLIMAQQIVVLDRYYDYFYCGFLIVLPYSIESLFKKKDEAFKVEIIFMAFLIYAGLSSIFGGIAGCYPFVFFN